jgi:threonine synthase
MGKGPVSSVVILYPEGRVSETRQAHQLGCFGDNIVALRVPSGFDPCQALVKQAFNDAALARSGCRFLPPTASASAVCCLRPRTTPLLHSVTSVRPAQSLSFIVPTGNLGNAVAALMAREVRSAHRAQCVFATNANRDHSRVRGRAATIGAGPSLSTLANAMDVGDPSNVAQAALHDEASDHDPSRAAFTATSVDDRDDPKRASAQGEAGLSGKVFCPAHRLRHRDARTASAAKDLDEDFLRGSDRPSREVR